MKFKNMFSRYYPIFFLSENRRIALGASLQFFNRINIQIMGIASTEPKCETYYSDVDSGDWKIAWEYSGYNRECFSILMNLLLINLKTLPDDFCVNYIFEKDGIPLKQNTLEDLGKYGIEKITKSFDNNPVLNQPDEITQKLCIEKFII